MTANQPPSDFPLMGVVVGDRYRIVELLGTGAMATVYRAVHLKFARAVAVKVMHRMHLVCDKMRARFEREAALAGRLRHANVVGVLDAGEHDDLPYLVMELAEGPSLTHLIDGTPLPPRRVLPLAKQLCDGLAHAHAAGVTHRDLKPDNIVVEHAHTADERARIVDFGLAVEELVAPRTSGLASSELKRITSTGLVFGTPQYMAPEQACGLAVDSRTDIYSLGATIFEMLTGCVPFDGEGRDAARANLVDPLPAMHTRAPFLDVDPLLEGFTRALMIKDRDARIQSAAAARALLELLEHDRPAAARQLGVTLPARSARRTAIPPLRR